MAAGRYPIPVPKFTAFEVKLAELSAQALWQGIDFRTNKLAEVSDELILNNFQVSFQRLVKRPALPALLTEPDLRQLIRVGELKAMFRSTLPLDFPKGIAAIPTLVVPTYRASTRKRPTIDRYSAGVKSVLDLSISWVSNPNPSLNGNYRVPFSSRILFFCAPEMMIFNYSNELGKAMQMQTRPQAALTNFNKLLNDGLQLNRVLFKKLKLPERSALSQSNWDKINKTDWWKRRVLDLALLIKYRVSVPHSSLVRKARALTRPIRKTP